jgi:hypothetical protein
LESFLEYIVDNLEEVFGKPLERKWLKVHLVYTVREWSEIFKGLKSECYGEITHIPFPTIRELPNDDRIDFYIYQWVPGLILVFTSSKEKDYEKTLKQFIMSKRGITESWIKPSLFQEMKNFLLKKYDAEIYRFISRRYGHWVSYSAKIRPEYDRRLSYSGRDADEYLKEMEQLYGIIPSSIDMRVESSQIQINRNGLFVIRHINRKTIGILQEIIEKIVAEQVRIRDTSEKFNIGKARILVGNQQVNIPRIVAGKITLPNTILSELMVNRMFRQPDTYELGTTEDEEEEIGRGFSFIDTYVEEGPLIFTATVVDELKGSIFGISGCDNKITLIPKHRITFESFIRFYIFVTENYDDGAKLTTFIDELIA